MSLIELQVELPQRALSFSVSVPSSGTILDVKREITRQCPGEPRVDGQRLICKGRILKDSDAIQQLWQSTDVRVLHLAVNPLSWTSTPPESSPPVTLSIPNTVQAQAQPISSPAISIPSLPSLENSTEVSYIHYLHFKALRTLAPSYSASAFISDPGNTEKERAKFTLAYTSRPWPSVFDEEWPEANAGDAGATYEATIIDGKPFLRLLTPNAIPTTAQRHALRVLTHTFPLLLAPHSAHLESGSASLLRVQQANPPPLLNLNNVNVIANANANAPANNNNNRRQAAPRIRVRAIPVRALLTPLILLCLRTMFLLYFFSPTRKPVFGLLLGAWVLYEAWGAVRGAFGVNEREGQQNQPGEPAGNRRREANEPIPGPNLDRNQPRRPMNLPAFPGAITGGQLTSEAILNRLAHLNITNEIGYLVSQEGTRSGEEPGWFEKTKLFITLFFLTLHPAIWNRRRQALRNREGGLRTEANARQRMVDEENSNGDNSDNAVREAVRAARTQLAQVHENRPRWVREYVDRAIRDDWLED